MVPVRRHHHAHRRPHLEARGPLFDHSAADRWRHLLRHVWHHHGRRTVQPPVRGPQLDQKSLRHRFLDLLLAGEEEIFKTRKHLQSYICDQSYEVHTIVNCKSKTVILAIFCQYDL